MMIHSTRGRKPIRSILKPIILKILSDSSHPLSVNQIAEKVQEELVKPPLSYRRKVSWNTIMKYLQELEKEGKVFSKSPKKIKVRYFWSKPIPW